MLRLVAGRLALGSIAAVMVVAYIGGWTVKEIANGLKKSRKDGRS